MPPANAIDLSRPPYRQQQERTNQAEQNCAVAHQDEQVWLVDGQAVQGRELAASQDPGQREQMNNAGDDQHCADDIAHSMLLHDG